MQMLHALTSKLFPSFSDAKAFHQFVSPNKNWPSFDSDIGEVYKIMTMMMIWWWWQLWWFGDYLMMKIMIPFCQGGHRGRQDLSQHLQLAPHTRETQMSATLFWSLMSRMKYFQFQDHYSILFKWLIPSMYTMYTIHVPVWLYS